MNKFTEDTITAIATPSGAGAISVIRVSGALSFEISDKIFKGKKRLSDSESHTIHYGEIVNERGISIDDVLISVFRNPHSYTGEDSIEISTHGNPLISKQIVELLIRNGARPAEPGEFTKRAYLNNKIDLAQAEAVADIISSRTDASLRGARNQLDGLLSKKVEEIRSALINVSSFVELELDFAEEDVEFVNLDELSKRIEKVKSEIETLLKSYSFGKVIKDGVNAAIVGKPNVGKSSLLNYILKESRAIVSHIPGTTRDIIREDVSIDGILFRLYDTAGIRISEDIIEIEGVLRSRQAVKDADIVLLISDVEQGRSEELLEEIRSFTDENKILKILNKIDLGSNDTKNYDAAISALSGEGIESLFFIMKEKALGSASYSEKGAIVSNSRHYECLRRAKETLEKAEESIKNKMSGEFISVDLRKAADDIGEIIGIVTSDDILNNIFTKFCIGK
ncbi:MAG TPA: tRNA uridine-5-carboxymethylaminomethyl(34) synthesis GTPase MnmE [Ignavibacteriaceae bacterium]|jgi:tRNA modification GTPase|nr:tRNA uridine-5-carboxymethylaminomethyl(34) synthesis GTPase MnmE [Ignavibacteriaceae bacterium]